MIKHLDVLAATGVGVGVHIQLCNNLVSHLENVVWTVIAGIATLAVTGLSKMLIAKLFKK